MRISNPRTFAGDLPLATREYVNFKSAELSGYVSETATNINGIINDVSSNIHDFIRKQDLSLSETIDEQREDIFKWLQGITNHNPATGYGYAWLGEDGKVDPSLIPPLSLINVDSISQFLLISDVQNSLTQSGKTNDIFENGNLILKDQIQDKFGLIEYWLRLQIINGSLNHPINPGDIILVSFSQEDDITENTSSKKIEEYTEFYKESIGNILASVNNVRDWYFMDNNIVGQYIVTKGQADITLSDGEYPQVQKLIFPGGTVRTVLGQAPNEQGDIKLYLSQLLKNNDGNAIGENQANFLMRINSTNKKFIGKTKLIQDGESVEHFTLADSNDSENIIAYARYDELSAVWENLQTGFKNIEKLSGNIDQIFTDISYLSGKINTTIENTLSNELGDKFNDSIASGMYAEVIKAPIYDQLRRIYNDITVDRNMLAIVSSQTDLLYTSLNNKAAGLQTLEFEWLCGPIAEFDKTNEYVCTNKWIYEPENTPAILCFERKVIQNEHILSKTPVIYSYNGTNSDNEKFNFGLYVNNLTTNNLSGDSEWAVYFCKINGKKQVVASYFQDKIVENNDEIKTAWQLVTPDVWYINDKLNTYTILAFIAKHVTDENSETKLVPGYEHWKLYLINNILES